MVDPDPVRVQGLEDGQHDDLPTGDFVPSGILPGRRRYYHPLNQYSPWGLEMAVTAHCPEAPFDQNWPEDYYTQRLRPTKRLPLIDYHHFAPAPESQMDPPHGRPRDPASPHSRGEKAPELVANTPPARSLVPPSVVACTTLPLLGFDVVITFAIASLHYQVAIVVYLAYIVKNENNNDNN
jgi:hypothetical protein